jgi:hypothetical protein
MNKVRRFVGGVIGLVLLLWVNPSYSQEGNTAYGTGALVKNSGKYNSAFGYDALDGNAAGSYNTAVGYFTLLDNNADFNTAVGTNALTYNTSGAENTAVGVRALFALTVGSNNTAFGMAALASSTDGTNNIAVGEGAGSSLRSGSYNIYLGSYGATTESSTMRLGNDSSVAKTLRTYIAGVDDVPVSGSEVLITSSGQLGIYASSVRYKKDIEPMGSHSHALLKLRPVTFHYKQDAQGERQYGLIAEEVAKVYPELVTRDASGAIVSVRYQDAHSAPLWNLLILF